MTSFIRDGEILGLHGDFTNGRSGGVVQYKFCGAHVRIDDTVRFKLTMVEIREGKNELQVTMKSGVVVQDGTELCTVAFWARTLLVLWRKQDVDIRTSFLKSLSCTMKMTIEQRGL
jgi:hypothetical protein